MHAYSFAIIAIAPINLTLTAAARFHIALDSQTICIRLTFHNISIANDTITLTNIANIALDALTLSVFNPTYFAYANLTHLTITDVELIINTIIDFLPSTTIICQLV